MDTGFFHWGEGGVTRGGYGIFPLGGGGLRNHQVQRTTITTCVFISTIADFRSGKIAIRQNKICPVFHGTCLLDEVKYHIM